MLKLPGKNNWLRLEVIDGSYEAIGGKLVKSKSHVKVIGKEWK